jgi:hypothetical protein
MDVDVDAHPSSRWRRLITRQLTHIDAPRFVHFCGSEQPRYYADFDARRPGRVQMLPEDVDAPEPSPKRPRRCNGCGTKVHASATLKPSLWLGGATVTSKVYDGFEDGGLWLHVKSCWVCCLVRIHIFISSCNYSAPSAPRLHRTAVAPVFLLRYCTLLGAFFFVAAPLSCLRGVIVFLSCPPFEFTSFSSTRLIPLPR